MTYGQIYELFENPENIDKWIQFSPFWADEGIIKWTDVDHVKHIAHDLEEAKRQLAEARPGKKEELTY